MAGQIGAVADIGRAEQAKLLILMERPVAPHCCRDAKVS
jgi:hypothetical protein